MPLTRRGGNLEGERGRDGERERERARQSETEGERERSSSLMATLVFCHEVLDQSIHAFSFYQREAG